MKKTLGTMIAELRKQHGMTQLELAEKMGVTDKFSRQRIDTVQDTFPLH